MYIICTYYYLKSNCVLLKYIFIFIDNNDLPKIMKNFYLKFNQLKNVLV